MAGNFRSAYIYARACGTVARAWTGSRAVSLARVGRVSELWKEVFGEQSPGLPERSLVTAFERKLQLKALEEFRRLAGRLAKDEPFFCALVSRPEYEYLKSLVAAISAGMPEAPDYEGLRFGKSLDLSGYPDPGRIFQKGPWSWIDSEKMLDLISVKIGLDRQYYSEIWDGLGDIPSARRGSLRSLVKREIELENVVWALRLRRYYGLPAEDIADLLISFRSADVTRSAIAALSLRPDARGDWSGWRWEGYINDAAGPGVDWALDVRHLETMVRHYIWERTRRAMHLEPGTYVPLYAQFRLKYLEIASLSGIAEGIHLEASAEELAAFAASLPGERQ